VWFGRVPFSRLDKGFHNRAGPPGHTPTDSSESDHPAEWCGAGVAGAAGPMVVSAEWSN